MRLLDVHRITIYRMLEDGRLKGTKSESGTWDIDDASVYRLVRRVENGSTVAELARKLGKEADRREQAAVRKLKAAVETYEAYSDTTARNQALDRMLEAAKELEGVRLYREFTGELMDEAIELTSALDDVLTQEDQEDKESDD